VTIMNLLKIRVSLIAAVLLVSAVITQTSNAKQTPESDSPTYYVYLAGPEVFLPDPIAAGETKKAAIQALNEKHNWPFTLVGLYPMDNEISDFKPDFATGLKIYDANIDLMNKAHFVTANMVRFRGPSMDVGTAFEMGYMRGLSKPVFAYYDAEPFYGAQEQPGIYADRVQDHYPVSTKEAGKDVHGQTIEEFQMADNLMMIGALESGAGDIATSFEDVILQIANAINSQVQLKNPSDEKTKVIDAVHNYIESNVATE